MWVQCGSSEFCNGVRFGGLSLEFCVGQMIEVRTDNCDGVVLDFFLIAYEENTFQNICIIAGCF